MRLVYTSIYANHGSKRTCYNTVSITSQRSVIAFRHQSNRTLKSNVVTTTMKLVSTVHFSTYHIDGN